MTRRVLRLAALFTRKSVFHQDEAHVVRCGRSFHTVMKGEKRKKPFTKANCICVKYGPTGGFLFPVGPGLTETLSLNLKQDVRRADMYFLHRLVSIEIYLNMCSV